MAYTHAVQIRLLLTRARSLVPNRLLAVVSVECSFWRSANAAARSTRQGVDETNHRKTLNANSASFFSNSPSIWSLTGSSFLTQRRKRVYILFMRKIPWMSAATHKIPALVKALALVATLATSACATRPPISFDPPPPANCCSGWQSVHFEEMGANGVSRTHISLKGSPTFDFAEGMSTFVAYRLPEVEAKTVEVDTYASSDWLPLATVFRPRVLFLDASLKEAGDGKLDPMARGSKFLGGAYYFATAPIPASAKYIVIYAASSANTSRLVARSENGSLYGLPNAYEGDISIILK